MPDGNFPLPPSSNGRLSPGDHAICLCDDAGSSRTSLRYWTQLALDAGDQVIWISRESLEAVLESLAEAHLLTGHLEAGRLLHWNSRDFFYPDGAFEPERTQRLVRRLASTAEQTSFRSLCLIVDMSWLLLASTGAERGVTLIGHLDALTSELNITTQCLYDRSRFEPGHLLNLLNLYPKIVLGDQVLDNFYYLPRSETEGPDADARVLQQRLDQLDSFHRNRQSLHDQCSLLRTMIDHLPASVFIKDLESRFVMVNASAARRIGVANPEDQIGKDDFSFLPPEIARARRDDDLWVLNSGIPLIGREEMSLEADTGRPLWFSTTKLPLRNTDGEVIGLIGTAWDITRRHQAEEELRRAYDEMERQINERTETLIHLNRQLEEEIAERQQAEEALVEERTLLRTLIDALPDAVYAKGRDGRYLLCNPANARILGQAVPDEIVGKSTFDVYPAELAEQFPYA